MSAQHPEEMGPDRDIPEINFGSVAEHYSGRVPYLPDFFSKTAEIFGLSKDSIVLDLACGTGELSFGFAPYCGSVLGIDKSPEMLSQQRVAPENVRFLTADLNTDGMVSPVLADLVVIGRAIQYFDKERLLPFLNSSTKKSASVLVCAAIIARSTPWRAEYLRLRQRYATGAWPSDYSGTACFAGSIWSQRRKVMVSGRMQYSASDLFKHSLSFARMANAILNDSDRFERELEELLTPYYGSSRRADAKILSWGLEYRRS